MTDQCILAVTIGRSDIKIRLLDENGHIGIYEVQKRSTCHFHQLLRRTLQNAAQRLQYPLTENSEQVSRTPDADCTEDGCFSAKGRPLRLPEGMLELIFPKLSAPVAMLAAEQKRHSSLMTGAIVYYTDRHTPQDHCEEPFAAGEIVQHWLAGQLKLEIAAPDTLWQAGTVCRINYAQGKTEIEGAGRDYPLYRSICAQLEAPLRQALNEFPHARLDLCTLGGMKAVNSVLSASARMFFARVRPLNTSEKHIAPQELAFADQALSAEENYQLRTQAIALLRQGHFAPAYTLLNTRIGAAVGEHAPWLQTLEHTHYLLQGQWRPNAYPHAGPLHQRLLSDRLHHCPRTLVLMLRVDAALHHRQFPAAMHLSLALPQAVLLDGIARFLQCQTEQERMHKPLERYWAMADEADCINVTGQRLELHLIRNPVLRKRIYDSLSKHHPSGKQGKKVKDDTLPATIWPLGGLWKNWPDPFVYSETGEQWLEFVDREDMRQYSCGETVRPLLPELNMLCAALQSQAQVLHTHTLIHSAQAWGNPRSAAVASGLAKPWLDAGVWEKLDYAESADDQPTGTWRMARPLLLPILQALGYGQMPPGMAELSKMCIAPMHTSVMA